MGSELVTLSLTPDAEVAAQNGSVRVLAAWAEHELRCSGPLARRMILGLAQSALPECEAERRLVEAGDPEELERFAFDVAVLLSYRLLRARAQTRRGDALATLESVSPQFRPQVAALKPHTAVALSRFSFLRRHSCGVLVVESPLAFARVYLDALNAAQVVSRLAAGASVEDLTSGTELAEQEAAAVVLLLLRAGVAEILDDRGHLAEDDDPALRQWDFHDLLFHSRSRLGRHDGPVGGRFRFLGEIPPQPAVKSAPWPISIVLPRPDLWVTAAFDPPLTSVIEARRSVRLLYGFPIGLARLGEFLYRVACVRRRYTIDDKGDFTSRPYPSGGASYELEIYVNIGDGAGAAPGFYWYDPVAHALCQVCEPSDETRGLMVEAHYASARMAWPQMLFVIAARFQRVSWKYDAMAYATILKNTGVLYSTMYLVATAMGLSPCALGLGDADRFTRLTGTRYVEESSVGEFMLCGAMTAPRRD